MKYPINIQKVYNLETLSIETRTKKNLSNFFNATSKPGNWSKGDKRKVTLKWKTNTLGLRIFNSQTLCSS
jgi:hypothetical protein